MKIEPLNGLSPDRAETFLGIIPLMLSEVDPRPAKDQLHSGYLHGGGWRPFEGFTLDPETLDLNYPGDPPTKAAARITLRDETIVVYEHAWVMILQKDGSYEIARMD